MTPLSVMQFVHFYYLDLHFLQFPISLLVVACLLACILLVAWYQRPLNPPWCPPPTPPQTSLDLVFIVSFFTLISMLTPLSELCTCAQCTCTECNLPLLWSAQYTSHPPEGNSPPPHSSTPYCTWTPVHLCTFQPHPQTSPRSSLYCCIFICVQYPHPLSTPYVPLGTPTCS